MLFSDANHFTESDILQKSSNQLNARRGADEWGKRTAAGLKGARPSLCEQHVFKCCNKAPQHTRLQFAAL